ncbi:MAG TPA: hypothetical protein VD965_11505 [Burkholderiales bacterium]|nr:hypothetical protein [Burkholderiales bacterium]
MDDRYNDAGYDDGYTNADWCEWLDEQHRRRYEAALMRHPMCEDPSHPGCSRCCEEDE